MKKLTSYFAGTCKKFLIRTNMHGFVELDLSKSFPGKIFWSVLILSCLTITTYQVTTAIQQHMDEPYITVIEKITEDELLYPRFRLCYRHWIYWVDVKKALDLNFTKETTLYGLSYLTEIYTHNYFDLDKVKEEFFWNMKSKNFKTLSDFYRAIAKPPPHVLLKDIEITSGYIFCYAATQDGFNTIILQSGLKEKIDKFFVYVEIKDPFATVVNDDLITVEEQNCYIGRFLFRRSYAEVENYFETNLNSSRNDTTSHDLLPYFDVDFEKVEIYSDDLIIIIRPQSKVSKWQSKSNSLCRKNDVSVHSDEYRTCKETCQQQFLKKSCICLWFWEISTKGVDDLPDKLCRYKIHFLSSVTNTCLPLLKETTVRETPLENTLSCTLDKNKACCVSAFSSKTAEETECRKSCTFACTVWKYNLGYVQRMQEHTFKGLNQKQPIQVYFYFPNIEEVLATVEINNQSFEKFVGNIGGLLGIWTGASILSIFQFIYLCCCGECACCRKRSINRRKQHFVRTDSPEIVDLELGLNLNFSSKYYI